MRTSEPVFELFLNYACTAKCPFCYNPPITSELLRRDLSFEQAAESLYKGAKTGAKILNLHGGEPTLRDDLHKILALAKKLGFAKITTVTNGVRLGEKSYADSLVKAGGTHFRISVHAAHAELHDRIVAIPGAFGKIQAALEHLQGLPVGFNFVLIKSNYKELPAFVKRFGRLGDLIVYFPHRRGMMELNEKAEGVSYLDVAPSVRAAAKNGPFLLANFVPCLMPELAQRMIDWGEEEGETAMVHPEGKTTDILEMKDSQRVPVEACKSCCLKDRCHGVEREYLKVHGEKEFNPLAGAVKA
jgi:MoaA/NifB/PqqE/SkfB family radical SAM enzyme